MNASVAASAGPVLPIPADPAAPRRWRSCSRAASRPPGRLVGSVATWNAARAELIGHRRSDKLTMAIDHSPARSDVHDRPRATPSGADDRGEAAGGLGDRATQADREDPGGRLRPRPAAPVRA